MGEALLGAEVIDGLVVPLDGANCPTRLLEDYDAMPPPAMVRRPITQPL